MDSSRLLVSFFFQAEDGIRDVAVTGVQTCALPISGVADLYSHSAGHQILLYHDLGILPENAAAALEIAQPGQQPAPAEQPHVFVFTGRSEERRVGKECRSWWSPAL